MEDDAPVIYGLEFQARALAAQATENEVVSFLVGTQSLKFDNQIHRLEYDEENNSVTKYIFLHQAGEIWHISASPTDSSLLSTCYNTITSNGKCEMHGALWRLPMVSGNGDACPTEDNSLQFPALEKVLDLELNPYGNEIKCITWNPIEANQLLSIVDHNLVLLDIEKNGSKGKVSSVATTEQKAHPKFTAVRWNPHQNCTLAATAIDTAIRSWDLRTMKQAWVIESAHGQLVRDLDFNPNRQYFLASGGDDCHTKFWDVRNTNAPVLTLSNHSHWVWSVRYNHFHDQLVLTSSSDSRVILNRAISISSEPFSHLAEDDEIKDESGHDSSSQTDGVIGTYEEHEDSVYATEWSTTDPWVFASLSYDGRLVINKVPRAEKYRILL